MFHSARIKLTAWYLLIITLICVSFTVAIYQELTVELNRIERMHRTRIERGLPNRILPQININDDFSNSLFLDPDLVAETKMRLKIILGGIDILIVGASTVAGYFLAGKTLKPISEMVEDQRRFVADASHELRTPLTAIKTEVEVALRDKKLNLPSAKSLLSSNLEEVDKLKSLTDYFLTLSKYQDANNNLSWEIFNLSQVAEEICNRLQGIAKEKRIEISKNLPKVLLEANKVSITELISILLDNAIKYSHPESKVLVSVEEKKGNVQIRTEDFGMGISSTDLPHIFNRFYRADLSRTKNVIKGYGLGLSIAKSVVDLHKGKIEVESVINKGSVFIVTLPLRQGRKLV